ncbi:hypothetical protein MWU52_09695 [Jannaschia sp. S6380]|uniref:hypothetical protein n=1 Tax=Jannaschia sp. S6380 TaxID=2926408 RepID=UPI001FF48F48|nr:hypothetical protein [Jannaschia sp. S6380]MCK0167819.1 hypothetical protein [Jannaschia sp. S6380]
MPLRNRVRPDGTLHAVPGRGTLTGNRGVLHDARGQVGPAIWKHRAWVCCRLSFRGRRRAPMPPGRWTALFFLDEAVALAAGHRPCGHCRHDDYRAFAEAWARAFGGWPGPKAADAKLHEGRAVPGARRLRHHEGRAGDLPTGAMFHRDGSDWLVTGGHACAYTPDGYGAPVALPSGPVTILTNPVTCAVLRAGFRPGLHASAR